MKRKIALSFVTSLILSQNIYANDTKHLDTVTVTAQKIEENVQDVPMSITVLNEYDIEDMRIESAKDIAKHTPNLLLYSPNSTGILMPTIRGINTDYGSFSTSMAMFIDGVPIIGTSGLDASISNVERIEVLKGPQGTLYGKGTESGVINIITKKPNNETKGKIGAEFGSDNKRQYTFSASGPIVEDKFYVGLSAKHYEKDGFVYNANLNKNADDIKQDYGKINLRYTPTDNLDISLISSKLKNDNTGSPGGLLTNPDRVSYNNEEYVKTETALHALKIEYDFDKYKLESITSKKEVKDRWLVDYDFTPEITSHAQNFSDKNTLSQELRLSSTSDTLNWLLGLNYSEDDLMLKAKTMWGDSYSTLNTESYGVFTHLDYQINHKFTILGGLRYDKIKSDFKEPSRDLDLDLSFNEISPKIGLEYNLNNDSMLYTTISKGYRPGGFYAWAVMDLPKTYEQETLWSYEIGSKNSLLDNRLIINTALYYMKIDDMQVHVASKYDYASYKDNAAKATSKGFEFDLKYQATDNLQLFASFGYNNTKFDEYKDENGDYSGNYNQYAPKYNYNIGAQYRTDDGYYARTDISGYGKMYFSKENTSSLDAYNLVNTKIGYEQENYDIYLYVDNLFDNKYDSIEKEDNYIKYSAPREIGIQLAYRF